MGLAGGGFTELNAMLSGSGFAGAIDLRTRNDAAVTISSAVSAGSFELSVDRGSIEVAGTARIDTGGTSTRDSNGGPISLWAGDGLRIDGGAKLLANGGAPGPTGANGAALAASGGNVTLGTASGQISIDGGTAQHPTMISMQGAGGAATDGTLTLRAPRTADDEGVQILMQNPSSLVLLTRNPVVVEGFKVYAATGLGDIDSGCGSGGTCDVNDLSGMLFTDAQTFVANTPTMTASLGLPNVQIRPGIEVDSTGDMIVNNSSGVWDLASWNAALLASQPAGAVGGVPVDVTLRAGGNLIFQSSLSDGFTAPTSGRSAPAALWSFGEPVGASTNSASYMLAGGADLSGANPLAVLAQPLTATSLHGSSQLRQCHPRARYSHQNGNRKHKHRGGRRSAPRLQGR